MPSRFCAATVENGAGGFSRFSKACRRIAGKFSMRVRIARLRASVVLGGLLADGIGDATDQLFFDAQNGAATTLPLSLEWSPTAPPLGGVGCA